MKTTNFACWLIAWFIGVSYVGPVACGNEPPANVIFILVDDLGWTDLGCYGSDFYETPNVDGLARQGVRFTQAYAASPVCSPTRASIMTGKFPARLDMTIWHEGAVRGGPRDRQLIEARSEPNLPREEITLAELFHDKGYFTAHVGKWHLGTAAYYPETQGYDVNVGGTFWGAPATFFFPFRGRWSDRDPEIRYVPGLGPGNERDYLTDRLTDHAIQLIQQAHQQPFFLSLWFHTVHTPIEGPPDLVHRYGEKTPGPHHKNSEYAAMVSSMDHNVGRVLDTLDQLELSDQTVVILTSDNGGVDFETRTSIPTNNSPLRAGKGTLYEGGIRVPLLIRWPKRSRRDVSCHEMVSSQDFYATLAEGFKLDNLPENIDGVSLLPLIEDPSGALARDTLYWHYPHYYPRMTPGSAVRHNNWKLIHYYEDDRTELYDLEKDLEETRDLADAQPNRTAKLRQELDAWRSQVAANAPTRRE